MLNYEIVIKNQAIQFLENKEQKILLFEVKTEFDFHCFYKNTLFVFKIE